MDHIKDYDDEGFELQFEDDTSPEEKKYYVQTYTNVNMVADRRLHCTCCDAHMGTAPSSEKIIRMHPVLRVTQCVKCYRFYNSGEFEKGEDGSELYCRWCGQGGDVYCCSNCPYVFCKKCILRNLTRVALKDVTSNDNWKCFSCAPKILYHLRAQHWALVNFIEKQKRRIMSETSKHDQDEIADAMNNDSSICCKIKKKVVETKKRKVLSVENSDDDADDSNSNKRKKNKKSSVDLSGVVDTDSDGASVDSERSAKRKRAAAAKKSVTAVEEAASTIAKNPNIQMKKVVATPPPPRKPSQSPNVTGPAKEPVVASTEATEIDCTPDLFAYLVNHSFEQSGAAEQSENSVSSSTGARAPSTSAPSTASTSQNKAPQAKNTKSNAMTISNVVSGPAAANIRSAPAPAPAPPQNREQFVRRVARSQVTQQSSAPVYHNYNGYRIDLNSAAQQSTIRLPNGKVIHVKKQAPLNSRNDPIRYSITAEPTPQPPQPQSQPQSLSMAQQNARSLPRPTQHPIQRVAAARAPPPPRVASQLRPSMINRAQPVHAHPPPLIINSVSSAVSMPPLVATSQPRMASSTAGAMGHMPLQQAQMQMQQMLQQPTRPQIAQMSGNPNRANAPNVMNTANAPAVPNQPNIPMPRVYTNDPVGRARTQLERQIFNAIQICHQIDGKLKTLMNSNAYKNVKKLHDIKELYIHLSYLFTYTNGRFQSVHDKCMEDMRRLGFKNDAKSLSSGNVIKNYSETNDGSDVDADDLEIVEPNHQTINLDSDDERTPEKNKSKSGASSARKATPKNPTELRAAEGNPVLDICSSTENLECDVDVTSLLQINMNDDDEEDDNMECLLTRMNDDVGIATPPDFEQLDNINVENDVKLNSKVTVTLKPVEQDYPELVEKAMQKLKDDKNKESATKTPLPEQSGEVIELDQDEEKTTEDKPVEEKPVEKKSVENQSHEEKPVEEIPVDENNAESTNHENLGNTTEKVHEEPECTNSDVAIDQPQQEENCAVTQNGDKQIENNQSKDDEPEEVESIPNEVQEVESVDAINKECQEPESPEEKTENPNCEPVTLNEDPDLNENEAKSIESDSDNDDKETPSQESHSEISSTQNEIEIENENEVENDNEVENENGSGNENDKETENENENEVAENQIENEVEIANDIEMGEMIDGNLMGKENKIDDEMESSDIEMNEVADINDVEESIVNEMLAEQIIGVDMIAEEIITEEIITEESIVEEMIADVPTAEEIVADMETRNETESIFSDLSDCNQLSTDDINNVISTTATLDVASLLESGDFENISSPETFN